MNLFNNIRILCDAPQPWGVYFQDSASPQMEALVELHDNIMFYLVIILFGVAWIMVSIIRNYVINRSPISNKYLNHGTLIELIWTITPALILILIAFPSFKLLYLLDAVTDPSLTVFVEGHQWDWSYQYRELTKDDDDDEEKEFSSYLVPDSDLEGIKLRLLKSIKEVLVPEISQYFTLSMDAPGGNNNFPGGPGNLSWPPRISDVPIGKYPTKLIFNSFSFSFNPYKFGMVSYSLNGNQHHYFLVVNLVIFTRYFNYFIKKYEVYFNNRSTPRVRALSLLFFCSLFGLVTPVSAYAHIPYYNVYVILCILLNLLYILFGSLYDLRMWRYKFEQYIFINKYINKIVLGSLYFITIFLGVWASNGTWYLTKDIIDRPLGIIITIFGTLVGSFLWQILATPPKQVRFIFINSIFRSIAECIAFNSISWLTYAAWDYFILYDYHILLGTILFTILHFLFSGIVIYLEILNARLIYYPIAYVLSFFCGVYSTNSFFELYQNYENNLITIILILLSGLLVIILHPDIYRGTINLEDITIRYIITRIVTYYLLFINYVFTTGLLFNYL